MRLELLVFDWDGTLMDSEARIVDCVRRAIADVGAEPRGADQIRDIIGLGLREAVLRLYPQAEEGFVEAMSCAYRGHFLGDDAAASVLFPGARTVVERLFTEGYRLAVATGKGRRGLDKALSATGLGIWFHASRCADETRSKPHPQMLTELMEALEVPPERTLMIGDTVYDLEMAHNAGARGLAVSYGVHPLARLFDQGPAGHIDALGELPAWLERHIRTAP